jgi:hypothetical protein
LTWLTWYQVEPDVTPAQSVLQLDPGTLATTVSVSAVPSVVMIGEVVDAPVRTLTPLHAGTIGWPAGDGAGPGEVLGAGPGMGDTEGGAAGEGAGDQLDPLSEKRQAK